MPMHRPGRRGSRDSFLEPELRQRRRRLDEFGRCDPGRQAIARRVMRKFLAIAALGAAYGYAQEGPQPRYVDPGKPGQPPSDAIVLFGGKDLSEWVHSDGAPAKW